MVNRKTRKVRNFDKIQHHHFLLRMEMKSCPSDADKKQAGELLQKIIRDIRMKPLDTSRLQSTKI